MSDLVTAIVPIYNVEKYLDACIQSLLAQTYPQLEILLVDDGATDASGALCEAWAQKDPRIRVLHKANGGLSDARNYGIARAKGDYLVFVDGDDRVKPTFIAELYQAISQQQADLALCSFELVDDSYQAYKDEILDAPDGLKDGHALLNRVLDDDGYKYVVAWNKIYRRDIFRQLLFEKGKTYEDEYMNFQLFWQYRKVVTLQTPLYQYVCRPDSITTSQMTPQKLWMKTQMQEERLAFYQDKDKSLYLKAAQVYCNWLVTCFKDSADLLDSKEKRCLQVRFRQVVKTLLQARVKTPLGLRCQNSLAYFSLPLAGRVKALVKRPSRK
ncbi:glycosyltransferase family 2 protein [Streptococcus sp. DD12]|uniref:glycosyltransferase family 2 protein n=1 Tax=Streptococcus sp. DD12 TaxID=1777880 RepID=UPI0007982376|nr:glycosyltransferase [Streptococcus sp. DD12]KXT76962.1 Beta-1,3-glucosyltransferase [Streptococcus sp. DD12]